MYKKTLRYEDFDGNIREETIYFNLSKAEVTEIELMHPGGYAKKLQEVSKSNDRAEIFRTFKEIIEMSYGEKSADGRHFVKSPEISQNFFNSAAYSEFLTLLMTDDGQTAIEFVNGIMPSGGVPKEDLYEKSRQLIESKKSEDSNIIGLDS